MNRFPFTPEGVTAMCQHYYSLSDIELEAFAQEAGADLPLWFAQTFILSDSQLSYVNEIAPSVTAFMAANIAFALANRLAIILVKDTQRTAASEPNDSKVAKPKTKLAANILPNGEFTAEGEFILEITY